MKEDDLKRKNPGRPRKKGTKPAKIFKKEVSAEKTDDSPSSSHKNWIVAQKSIKPKFQAVEDITDEEEFDDGNEFNAVNELVEVIIFNLFMEKIFILIFTEKFRISFKNQSKKVHTRFIVRM